MLLRERAGFIGESSENRSAREVDAGSSMTRGRRGFDWEVGGLQKPIWRGSGLSSSLISLPVRRCLKKSGNSEGIGNVSLETLIRLFQPTKGRTIRVPDKAILMYNRKSWNVERIARVFDH
jgi:hypothetical protein